MTDDRFRDREKELTSSGSGSGLRVGQIVGIVALVIFVVFIFQNRDDVPMSVLWMQLTLPAWVYFVGVFLLGAVFGWFSKGRRSKKKG